MEGKRSVRALGARTLFLGAAAAALALGSPSAARAEGGPTTVEAAIFDAGAPREVRAFYQARNWRPLWVRGGAIGPEAETLIRLIETAELDGLDPGDYKPRALRGAIERAAEEGDPKALAKAELMLSRALAQLGRDMARPAKRDEDHRAADVLYADAELRPAAIKMRDVLEQAGAAPSLAAWLDGVGWMNPVYAKLRVAAIAGVQDGQTADLVRVNLERAKAFPNGRKRFVLVDAAAQRLWMYEGRRAVGSMKVVVGKPTEPTPMMAALIRYANVNPYWNLPPDLARLRVAPGAREKGDAFLKAKRFEVLSGWEENARPISAAAVDWAAVEAGRAEVRVRQLPGPNNAMGRVKFMFPNEKGVYLHDTPEKELMREDARNFSSGCVRVEDAARLGRWLFGKPLSLKPGPRERRVDLPTPVPVFITYLTVGAEGDSLVFRPDPYGRDGGRGAGAMQYASR